MPQRDLRRIREIIEKGEAGSSASEDRRTQIDRVDEVIRRVQTNQEPEQEMTARVAHLRASVEGGEEEIDFSKVDLTGSSDSRLRIVGRAYNFFKPVLASFAGAFSSLPIVKSLKVDLLAAGMTFSTPSYIVVATTASAALALAVFFAVSWTGITARSTGIEFVASAVALASIAAVLSFVLANTAFLFYPGLRASERSKQIDRELPFALRHLATQVKAGVPFVRAMQSVEKGGYNVLSIEIRKFLAGLQAGESTEQALLAMHARTKSRGLRQAIMQVIRSLKTGGSLADSITAIADDVSFESQMRIRDFTEQLNLVSIVFVMLAVVAPVVLTILASVTQLPLIGGVFSPVLITLSFGAIALLVAFMLFFIKTIEPTAA